MVFLRHLLSVWSSGVLAHFHQAYGRRVITSITGVGIAGLILEVVGFVTTKAEGGLAGVQVHVVFQSIPRDKPGRKVISSSTPIVQQLTQGGSATGRVQPVPTCGVQLHQGLCCISTCMNGNFTVVVNFIRPLVPVPLEQPLPAAAGRQRALGQP
jgi:hypothetical protein